MEDQIKCPKCSSTQISANKKGFSGTKAIAGNLIAGPAGLLAGVSGSNKIRITCLSCGNEFKPGDIKAQPLKYNKQDTKNAYIILSACFIILVIFIVVKIFGK